MTRRISSTHLFFLTLVVAASLFLIWSSAGASPTTYNLIVVVPAGVIVILLTLWILIGEWRAMSAGAVRKRTNLSETFGDILLLALFAGLCLGLTGVGFDVATFLFIWIGVHLCGERRLWAPPLFAAACTFLMVKFFGPLFPFPMPLLVL